MKDIIIKNFSVVYDFKKSISDIFKLDVYFSNENLTIEDREYINSFIRRFKYKKSINFELHPFHHNRYEFQMELEPLVYFDLILYFRNLEYSNLNAPYNLEQIKFHKNNKLTLLQKHISNYRYNENRVVNYIENEILNGNLNDDMLYIINNVEYFKQYSYLVDAKKFDLI